MPKLPNAVIYNAPVHCKRPESKAQPDEKAQHTREYVSILKRAATQLSGLRWGFETASSADIHKAAELAPKDGRRARGRMPGNCLSRSSRLKTAASRQGCSGSRDLYPGSLCAGDYQRQSLRRVPAGRKIGAPLPAGPPHWTGTHSGFFKNFPLMLSLCLACTLLQ